MFCWRLHNDQQHLASVAPDFRSSSSSIIAVRVPVVVVVVVEIAATTIMTCTEQNLSQILLDNMRCEGFCSQMTSSMPGSLNQSVPELLNWGSEISVWVSAKAWDTTGNGSLNDLKCCISIVQIRSYKNVSLKTHHLSSNFIVRGFGGLAGPTHVKAQQATGDAPVIKGTLHSNWSRHSSDHLGLQCRIRQ